MRFDELPAELIALITKCCDPFTRNQIRLSSKRIRNLVDKHVQFVPNLQDLSLEITSNDTGISGIRLRTCTEYGREEEQIRKLRNQESTEVLTEILNKVSLVRRLHLSRMTIDKILISILVNEDEKMRCLSSLVLEDCSIEVGKPALFRLFTIMRLKCVNIIRCRGAYHIVNDSLIKMASEEVVVEGVLAAGYDLYVQRPEFGEEEEDDPDYKVPMEKVNREIQITTEEIRRIEEEHPFQRFPWGGAMPARWGELQAKIRRLQQLSNQVYGRDLLHPPEGRQLDGQRRERRQLIGLLERDRQAHVERSVARLTEEERERSLIDARYKYITKRTLNYLVEHPLPRLEFRNLTVNYNLTIAAITTVIKETVKNESKCYWNLGSIVVTNVSDLQELSSIPNIIWNPQPTWERFPVTTTYVYNKFEMRTMDGKKTFIFATNAMPN